MTRLLMNATVILVSTKLWSILIVLQHTEYDPSNRFHVFAIFVVGNRLYNKAVFSLLHVAKALFQADFARFWMDFKWNFILEDAVLNSISATAKSSQSFSCGTDIVGFFNLKIKSCMLES